ARSTCTGVLSSRTRVAFDPICGTRRRSSALLRSSLVHSSARFLPRRALLPRFFAPRRKGAPFLGGPGCPPLFANLLELLPRRSVALPLGLDEPLRDASDFLRRPVGCLERLELVDREQTPLSGTQPFSVDARVAHPHQSNQRRPCVFSEPSHLAVPPLVDRDLEPGVTALAPKGAHGSGF